MSPEDGKVEFLVGTLKERIKRGDFGTSGRLPTIAQFAKEYKMARDTVHSALQILRAEGLLLVKNAAYVVNNPVLLIEGTPNFDRYLQKQGLAPVFKTVGSPEAITMPDEIAILFNASKGLRVVHRLRVQGTSEVPLRLEENWYPADLALPFLENMKQDDNMNVAREIRLSQGFSITKIKEDVLSRYPTQEECKLLNIARISPVLEARRNFLTSEERTVIFNRTTMVAAFFLLHYEYDTSFEKVQQ